LSKVQYAKFRDAVKKAGAAGKLNDKHITEHIVPVVGVTSDEILV